MRRSLYAFCIWCVSILAADVVWAETLYLQRITGGATANADGTPDVQAGIASDTYSGPDDIALVDASVVPTSDNVSVAVAEVEAETMHISGINVILTPAGAANGTFQVMPGSAGQPGGWLTSVVTLSMNDDQGNSSVGQVRCGGIIVEYGSGIATFEIPNVGLFNLDPGYSLELTEYVPVGSQVQMNAAVASDGPQGIGTGDTLRAMAFGTVTATATAPSGSGFNNVRIKRPGLSDVDIPW